MKILEREKTKQVIKEVLEDAFISVGHTLGPKGTNACIKLNGNTIITNDGISILRELKFKESEKNMALQIIKEACINTENKSGDGTTSSIVLTKAFYDYGIKAIEKGENPVIVKKRMMKYLEILIEEIKKKSKRIENTKEIINIANISLGGNTELAERIANEFALLNFKGNINIKLDPNSEKIKIINQKGFCFDKTKRLINNDKTYKNVRVLIYEGKIENHSDIAKIAELNMEKQTTTIIVSEYETDVLYAMENYRNFGNEIIPYELPSYGSERNSLLRELYYITDASQLNSEIKLSNYSKEEIESSLGLAEVISTKSTSFIIEKAIDDRFEKLLNKITDKNRKQEIENGISTIYIGAKTDVEATEIMYRIEDCLNSLKLAIKEGINIGGANLFFKLSNVINDLEFKNALKIPLQLIFENSSLEKEKINEILTENNVGFNAESEEIEDLFKAGVIDPTATIINILKSSISIASSLLTINVIISED